MEYLGHLVDAQGLHTTEAKRKAVADAPAPKICRIAFLLGARELLWPIHLQFSYPAATPKSAAPPARDMEVDGRVYKGIRRHQISLVFFPGSSTL